MLTNLITCEVELERGNGNHLKVENIFVNSSNWFKLIFQIIFNLRVQIAFIRFQEPREKERKTGKYYSNIT